MRHGVRRSEPLRPELRVDDQQRCGEALAGERTDAVSGSEITGPERRPHATVEKARRCTTLRKGESTIGSAQS